MSCASLQIVGPIADSLGDLYGDYSATPVPEYSQTPYQGLKAVASNTTRLAPGCDNANCKKYDKDAVVNAVRDSDFVIVCLGSGRKFFILLVNFEL